MDDSNYILIAMLAIFPILSLMPTNGVKQITTAELNSLLNDKNKQYIDVRTPGEFKARNIKGFKNIPLHQLALKSNVLSKEKEVIVICQNGMRSNKASKILKKQGFKQVTNVLGGISAWK